MLAMVLESPGKKLQKYQNEVVPPEADELLIKVTACGVCRTDLHVVDGELKNASLPVIPGHEIVGVVESVGSQVSNFSKGERVVVPWLGKTCQNCKYCLGNQENLCDHPLFTGYTIDGGFAEYTKANYRYCFKAPQTYEDVELAPLLCAGLIGWRSYKFADAGTRIGVYGFGAAAHIITQVAIHYDKEIYAFTRPGDSEAQKFALNLGAKWAGGSDQKPPQLLDSAIIFAPVGSLIVRALESTCKGGVIVCGGIYMSDIPTFSYSSLWHERVIRSVANLTRDDALEFLSLAPKIPVRTNTHVYKLEEANKALSDLKQGKFNGAAVLVP